MAPDVFESSRPGGVEAHVGRGLELRGLDAQIALLRTTLAAFERALQLTKARYDQGVASGVDVAQAQTQLDTTRTQATDLLVARAQFKHDGIDPGKLRIEQASPAKNSRSSTK